MIIGGGTAGLAAAIAAQQAGLESVVLERDLSVPARAGETVHPGIAPILQQLGVLYAIEREATGRFAGIYVSSGDEPPRFESFGTSANATWLGYHIARDRMGECLLDRAVVLGSRVCFGCKASKLHNSPYRRLAVETPDGSVHSDWVLDATGPHGFSARRDRSGYHRASKQRTVSYSYGKSDRYDAVYGCAPLMRQEPWGWIWTTSLGDGRIAKVTMTAEAGQQRYIHKHHFSDVRHADGTWVVSNRPSGEHLFRIGDAALRFDPSAGKGILRAMMTAMMAVHLIRSVTRTAASEVAAAEHYHNWIHKWVNHDCYALLRHEKDIIGTEPAPV